MAALQRVIEDAPTYAELVTGAPPGLADAQSTFTALPPGKTYADKHVFGIYQGSRMVGCIDLIHGHPVAWSTCTKIRLGVLRTNAAVLPFWIARIHRNRGDQDLPLRASSVRDRYPHQKAAAVMSGLEGSTGQSPRGVKLMHRH
jgi:hypothetical protein